MHIRQFEGKLVTMSQEKITFHSTFDTTHPILASK